jgi:hypothetical protein
MAFTTNVSNERSRDTYLQMAERLFLVLCTQAFAQNTSTPQNDTWVAKDFRFQTGEVMPSMNIGYTTLGNPSGEPVVILHGTTGTNGGKNEVDSLIQSAPRLK